MLKSILTFLVIVILLRAFFPNLTEILGNILEALLRLLQELLTTTIGNLR